jgi:hypothetical protein
MSDIVRIPIKDGSFLSSEIEDPSANDLGALIAAKNTHDLYGSED